jgi:hypothetical protein
MANAPISSSRSAHRFLIEPIPSGPINHHDSPDGGGYPPDQSQLQSQAEGGLEDVPIEEQSKKGHQNSNNGHVGESP